MVGIAYSTLSRIHGSRGILRQAPRRHDRYPVIDGLTRKDGTVRERQVVNVLYKVSQFVAHYTVSIAHPHILYVGAASTALPE